MKQGNNQIMRKSCNFKNVVGKSLSMNMIQNLAKNTRNMLNNNNKNGGNNGNDLTMKNMVRIQN